MKSPVAPRISSGNSLDAGDSILSDQVHSAFLKITNCMARESRTGAEKGLAEVRRWQRTVAKRVPFELLSEPFVLQTYRYAYYARVFPENAPWRIFAALANRLCRLAWRPIYRLVRMTASPSGRNSILSVLIRGVRRTAVIDGRNTQFIALDSKVAEFKSGYEPEISALLDVLLPSGGTFFDIGANWGYFSIYAASRQEFSGRVEAFEPVSSTYKDLTGLTNALGLQGVVRCHRIAISDEDGSGTISTGVHSGVATLIDAKRGEVVRTARLDSLNLPTPHVVKIDVEGSEAKAIRGARRTIQESRPMILFENLLFPDKQARALDAFHILAEMDHVFYLPFYDPISEILTLTSFQASDRLVLPLQINVLACHVGRRQELEAAFVAAAR